MSIETLQHIDLESVYMAQRNIREVIVETPLSYIENFSERFEAAVYFKREDLQVVRSYKIRGAYNKIKSLDPAQLKGGIVCASAGNHAQGVALACNKLGVHGTVFMPVTTPKQKVMQVRMFGKDKITIKLFGDTFDESYEAAVACCLENKNTFVHPFDDKAIIAGQGTIGLEILKDTPQQIDYLFLPVGGGGMASGVASVFKKLSPYTKLIGVEPEGAPSLTASLKADKNVTLDHIEKFVDGAAVKRMGELTFGVCRDLLDAVITIPEGLICDTLLNLYNENAIVAEPAGVLSIAALEMYKDKVKGKNVVCILSGGNNDITRMEEMKERALLYKGLKHYFIINFVQRAGALKEFVEEILGPDDDITFFEYAKKNNREYGSAVVGIELKQKEDFRPLLKRMKDNYFLEEYLNDKPQLFRFLV